MVNHRILPRIGVIVFAVSLFSSSIFSGLVTITSPSFPWNSALASSTGTDTEDETQSPRTLQEEEPQAEPPTVVEPPPPPPPPPPDDQPPVAEPPTVAEQPPDEQPPPPPPDEQPTTNETTTEPPTTNETTTNRTTTGGNQTAVSNATFTQTITGLQLQERISVQIQPPACTTGSGSEHWNKIVFRITRDLTGRIDSSLINTELEVLERVNDGGVLNLKDIVRYSIVNEPGILPQLTFEEADQLEIEILDVEYALICFR